MAEFKVEKGFNRRVFFKGITLGLFTSTLLTSTGCQENKVKKSRCLNLPENLFKIGDFDIVFLSHVCFQFRTPQGKLLLVDPFFAPGFIWRDSWETHFTRPQIKIEDIKDCDVIFVSHVHGDHCDCDALVAIQKQTSAQIIAPATVLDYVRAKGGNEKLLKLAERGKHFQYGDLHLNTYGGYDALPEDKARGLGSRDTLGRDDKFALTIQTGSTKLFYSGDCHELPPAVTGKKFDTMFCWPHGKDDNLKALCDGLDTNKFVIMHCGKFNPGKFYCNFDTTRQKNRIESLCPGIEVYIPKASKEIMSRK